MSSIKKKKKMLNRKVDFENEVAHLSTIAEKLKSLFSFFFLPLDRTFTKQKLSEFRAYSYRLNDYQSEHVFTESDR